MNIFFWTVCIASLVAINCTLIGSFLVVRKQAMLGDAIAHTALLGIVLAFLVSNSMHPFIILTGAIIAGIASTLLVSILHRQLGTSTDMAINITFSTFFSLAIILIMLYTEKVDLDLECVLYGQLPMMPFDVWLYKGYNLGPKAIYLLLALLLANISFVTLCYPMLMLTSFDPMFATIMGVNTKLWHYSLMVMAAVTTVITYKIVGSVLVLAFLVIPTITVYLLTSNFLKMLVYACILSMYIALGGYALAFLCNASVSGGMVIVASLFFALAFGTYRYKHS